MSITKKLVLLVALALTATAVASAPAYATATITPSGTYTGDQNGPGTLASDDLGATITCDTSNFTVVTGTGTAPNTATRVTVTSTARTLLVTGLTFGACTASVGGGGCTVSVDTLPAKLAANKVTTTAGATTVATWTAFPVIENATILCGAGVVHCDASVDTTLHGTADVNPQTNNTFDIEDQQVDIDDGTSVVCGTTATWNSSWTILDPASYTIAP